MNKRILYHIAFWVAYVLFKSYLNFDSGSFIVNDKSGIELFMVALWIQLVFVTIKIPLVYALFNVTDKYLSKQWSIFKTILAAAILFAIAIICYLFLNHYIVFGMILEREMGMWMDLNPLSSISYYFFILSFVSGIAIAIKLVRLNIKQKADAQELLKNKLEIELQFLKAQTNPHFLFNTLNNIYALARKNSDKTADVVMTLSNMLRYMLYETFNGPVEIENEIKIINDYIELEKLRYSKRLEMVFNYTVDNYKEKLAPLILLPFVENAFKHGAGESRFQSYIHIDLKLIDKQLSFEIKNSKEETKNQEIDKNIGLKNIQRQLELLYPTHKLSIVNSAKEFIVKLNISLKDGNI
ncbi:MAG: hypothetical protein COW44_00645 [Flavobacteriaceae bacterium CG17_big_fil_post_rev_8_21_14_2_50_33_15]|nr:MAG: hypothetical protein COW44_00645 [Flavobacteriaceae bacterium CG17_big_fil_post_rev_8_21_14_2_50_33_15]PJB19090.1 MAG: hypothetical protein CO117_05830 [Flavobacteriaceae bacterium CG_4_9_14_3_um_filter_33_16]